MTVTYRYAGSSLAEVQTNHQPAIRYTYDAKSRLIRVADPRNGNVEYVYDDRNRIVSRTPAGSAGERYEYDDVSGTIRHTDPAGGVTTTKLSVDREQQEITPPKNQPPGGSITNRDSNYDVMPRDPGELEGYWSGIWDGLYEFAKSGTTYHGYVVKIQSTVLNSDDWASLRRLGYKEGEEIFTGTRVGPNTYRGTYRNRYIGTFPPIPGSNCLEQKWHVGEQAVEVNIGVLGNILKISSPHCVTCPCWEYYRCEAEFLPDLMRLQGSGPWSFPEGVDRDSDMDYWRTMSNEKAWFLASRIGPDGQKQYAVYHDFSDPEAIKAIEKIYQQLWRRPVAEKNPRSDEKRWRQEGQIVTGGIYHPSLTTVHLTEFVVSSSH